MLTGTFAGTLISNASVMIAFVYFQYYLYVRYLTDRPPVYQHLYMIVGQALVGLIAMMFSYPMENGAIFDTRMAPLFLLVAFSGNLPIYVPLATAGLIALERFLFGVNAAAVSGSLNVIVTTVTLVLIERLILRRFSRTVSVGVLIVLGSALTVFVLAFIGVIPPRKFLTEYGLALFTVNVTAAVGLGFLYRALAKESQMRNNWRTVAERDFLTDLSNRRALDHFLQARTAEAMRSGSELSVAMIDIDFFKRVNDTYGHEIGDAVLREVAARIRRQVRSSDMVGRYGGEEFLVIFPHLGKQTAVEITERIRRAVDGAEICVEPCDETGLHGSEVRLTVTVSAGVATQSELTPAQTLVGVADERLYAAKRGGRNQVVAH